MTEPRHLLEEYVRTHSETAFAEMVDRYVNLVYGTALRLVNGNRSQAEDVTQLVFISLARKAGGLHPKVTLGGWLYESTYHLATKSVRTERRRQNRELEALKMNEQQESRDHVQEIAGLLDDALRELSGEDREAILLRFFEQHDYKAMGAALSQSEDAARMRVNRALEKLQHIFRRRGFALSVGALSTVLATEASVAAPAGLAASVAGAALAGTGAGAALLSTFIKSMSLTSLKAGVVGVLVVAGVATPLIVLHNANAKLREQQEALRMERDVAALLATENERLSNALLHAQAPDANGQLRELLKLRNEVGALKTRLATAEKRSAALASEQSKGDQNEDPREEAMKQQFIAKMNDAKNWMIAFHLHAEKNQGKFPSSFEEAVANLPEENREASLAATNQFEVVYTGSLTSVASPASTIVLREIEMQPGLKGGWLRTYGFADGHAEVHRSEDGDFKGWESQHLASTAENAVQTGAGAGAR